MRTLIVIPARLESTRLPRKLLLSETGKPLIAHVVEQCWGSRVGHFVVVTDSHEIGDALSSTGAFVRYSTSDHPNGTSRAASIANAIFEDFDAYCIVQGDCPEIDPELIDQVVEAIEQHPEWDCATASCANLSAISFNDMASPSKVKVIINRKTHIAVDFARHAGDLYAAYQNDDNVEAGIHIGIYCYRREALLKYAAAGPCEREVAESLEQLRALHIGLKMGVVLTDKNCAGIDTREDYDAFVARYQAAPKTA